MLCTLKIKLMPSTEQFNSLLKTMKQFNSACNHISKIVFESKTFAKTSIQKFCYYGIREKFNLSAQMTIRAIGKVSESYRADKKTLHAFKDIGAMVYDERILSFKGLEYASILTLDGRIEVPLVLGAYHSGLLQGNRVRGQADLILQGNVFYLLLVVEVPERETSFNGDFIGVDLGIVNIAVDSTDEIFSISEVNATANAIQNFVPNFK